MPREFSRQKKTLWIVCRRWTVKCKLWFKWILYDIGIGFIHVNPLSVALFWNYFKNKIYNKIVQTLPRQTIQSAKLTYNKKINHIDWLNIGFDIQSRSVLCKWFVVASVIFLKQFRISYSKKMELYSSKKTNLC